ncbi:MAG: hypothetical protein M1826_002872 [Phylliscum demangeonii]|nr:MAG: hypothetical protein M1826_002872 [Phylliscum demangeonii]
MSNPLKIQEFPEISNKLAAPTKKSQFERQRAEAEAKRLRAAAETAAVFEDFVKSFEDEGPARSTSSRDRFGGREVLAAPGGGSLGGPSRRHFATAPSGPTGRGGIGASRTGLPSKGPGSLGPPPPSLGHKRAHDGTHPAEKNSKQALFAFADEPTAESEIKPGFPDLEDDDEHGPEDLKAERAGPRPNLHLSMLPPGSSPAVIKSYLPSHIVVETVRILPPTGPGSGHERRSMSALVTIAKDTAANDIDAAVNALQNKYLGSGYYLSISRHLSSAALGAGAPIVTGSSSALSSLPFGARPVYQVPAGYLSRAPPPHYRRGGFAPPSSYGHGQHERGSQSVQVSVSPPSDLAQLKLIHKTVEALLTHGPEFEALLMSRVEVQREERWAWLWDARSPGGVWYRWRLWEILSGSNRMGSRNAGRPNIIFESGAAWVAPSKPLRFEHTTHLEEFVSDSEYNSSDEEHEDEGDHQYHGGDGPPASTAAGGSSDAKTYLDPLQKSKLTHLLARLPTTTAKLRKGDVARVTAFAIEHAGPGADEVVDMITSNIWRPFALTSANPDRKRDEEHEVEPNKREPVKDHEDTSASKLIALYVISDILSSSSTSGVRHAWKYRQLFETVLKQRMVFEGLGQLEKAMQWGRLRAEKWKRSINSILTLWEGWCVFPHAAQEHFVSVFNNPPPTAAELKAADERASAEAANASKSKWKTVDVKAQVSEHTGPLDFSAPPAAKYEPPAFETDVDGEPMLDDGDLDGEMMEDLDGEPMADSEDEQSILDEVQPMEVDSPPPSAEHRDPPSVDSANGTSKDMRQYAEDQRKGDEREASHQQQPKAEDMFADSDDD